MGSDVRSNPKISGTTHNVFGIQTGVAIGFFVRDSSKTGSCNIHYARREDAELAIEKLAYLSDAKLNEIAFEDISPDAKNYWLDQSDTDFDIADSGSQSSDETCQRQLMRKTRVFGLYSDWHCYGPRSNGHVRL